MNVEARIDAALTRREVLPRKAGLEAVRLVNGAGDGLPGVHVDRFGPILLVSTEEQIPFGPILKRLLERCAPQALFRRTLARNPRARRPAELAPELVLAEVPSLASGEIVIREQGNSFLIRAREGGSPGLFLDQRDNRAHLAALVRERLASDGSVLNTFAHTCSFSVAAAMAGARTTSVDLSARWLDWGRANFAANGLDSASHEFARGDALTFLEIAAKKQRSFDLVVLDPPTFSTSKQHGVFQVERHFGRLFELAARVAAPGAAVLCSHNQRTFTRAALAAKLRDGARAARRRITKLDSFSPPPDFPGRDDVNPAARGFWVELDGAGGLRSPVS